ncbi:TRAP transporter substrate-binding protein [Caldimonas thermodepolymerans]|jgi:tripartite ATP-independent transporter DctP family solute receptor|uniref:ABC transporter substrate-binding protein n=1 Tax=Caldimonas thermodepolymerans TaxID=215580 RepID=A0A2S5T414_9BURK|nr:TRAP transporter substrate-binding protein [Caldimonas thermodepolymerans]PPE69702.1 ABC transporter substrate-binding protein [Caldimonas thermodepolymerans]QPC31887.1 TRAP transporter substrate-binding protein [Caldimonas thermodepolymerans]RDI01597.1 tripartite ATP-independent transporter DctP family solute receptor [Caldimonas thermodepolymerans]TCP04955.1 tripartite ATP-independent transporter DctP family solute receptor [Caldimonas thermodepolymerans]UZG48328.1 TRAP transporter substr
MKKLLKTLALGMLLPAFMAASQVHAADIKNRTLRFSHVQPKESHMGYGVEQFAKRVREKSDGKINIRIFHNGTLGGDIQTLSALQGGTIDMTTMPPGLMVGLSAEYGVFDIPFLFQDFREADAVLDGPLGKKMMERLPRGLVGLAYWDHGFRNLSNNKRPIAKLEDIQGLKLRVLQAPLMLDTFKALGANAVPLPFTELFTAMETNAVDGQDNPIVAFETNKFYEVQKHLSSTRHVYNPLIVLVSQASWNKLTPDEQKLLREAAEEVRADQRKVSREMEAKAIEKAKQHGTIYTDITPRERARMAQAVAPVIAQHKQQIGAALVDEFLAEVAKVRQQQQ